MRTEKLFKFIFFISLFIFEKADATTTSGITARQVNVADGNVVQGNTTGSNSANGAWETDEKFAGFNGIVNWFLTWDDTNLYIGKVGGNNAQGSMIYIRADFTGSTFSNNTQVYDGFNPNLSLMNGINFVAYLKTGYNEFRNYNGTWSAANSGLNPAFTNNASGDNFEMAIPWNSITNGNGKPNNVRAVFYQDDQNSASCSAQSPNPFLYAESPWGTGVGADGPNVGVNDGTPTSGAQPGGCGNATATITRWWGCYPVIGGVGANGFVATPPNAGTDINICSTQNTTTLNGSEPAADAVGTWSLVTAPNGATPVIASPNNKNTTVNNLDSIGEYIFVWNINYGLCPAIPDTVKVGVWQNPANANAGTDQLLNCGATTTILNATAITPAANFIGGTGVWTSLNNQINIVLPNQSNSNIGNIPFGNNTLVWTISNAGCPSKSDTVNITNFAPTLSNAGVSANVCGSQILLAANNPATIQSTASGLWSTISAPVTPNFTVLNAFNTSINNLQTGTYILKWKVSNGNCNADSSNISLTVYPIIEAGNGSAQLLCNQTSAQVTGLNPTTIHPSVNGVWSVVSGTGISIANNTSASTNINNLSFGTYIVKWKLSNGICPSDSANYTIQNFAQPIANAGIDDTTCGTSVQLLANNPSNIQASATGIWSNLSATGNIANTTSFNTNFNNLSAGTYNLKWKVSNGVCLPDSNNVQITVLPTINAGADVVASLCNLQNTTLQGLDPNTISPTVTGLWSVVSGNATIVNNQSFNSNVTNLDTGTTTFKWKLSNGICPSDSANYTIQNFAQPIANAGIDETLCATSVQLLANNPSSIQASAAGVWSIISGNASATFNNVQNFDATISNLSGSNYQLLWTVTNGVCAANTDTLNITLGTSVNASLINNTLSFCDTNAIILNAVAVANATTLWTKITGASTSTIANASNAYATVTGLGYGISTFEWKVTGTCNSDSATLTVRNYKKPIANAGEDKLICQPTIQLSANNPSSVASSAVGLWQVANAAGTISFSSNASFNATISNLQKGNYNLKWTVTNGNCPTATDFVNIAVSDSFEIEKIEIEAADNEINNAVFTIVQPTLGSSPYQYSINTGSFDVSNIFDSLFAGKYYVLVKDAAGCITDTIIEIKTKLYVPTGISPNGDGINDTWNILRLEDYPTAEINVYSTWGEKIFESIGNQKTFDGTYEGKPLPEGNYYFTVDLKNQSEPMKGKITILR